MPEAFNDLLRCSASNIGGAVFFLGGDRAGKVEHVSHVSKKDRSLLVEEMNKAPAARETPATIEAYKGLL